MTVADLLAMIGEREVVIAELRKEIALLKQALTQQAAVKACPTS